jgi:hypothetical protein
MKKLLALSVLAVAMPALGQSITATAATASNSLCAPIIGSGGPPPAGQLLICVSWTQMGASPNVIVDTNNNQTSGPVIEFLGRCVGGPSGCSSSTQQQSIGPFLGSTPYTSICSPTSPGAPVPNCTAANVQTALVAYNGSGQNQTAWSWAAISMTQTQGLYIDQVPSGSLLTYAAYASWPGGALSGSSTFFTFTASTPSPTIGVAPQPSGMNGIVIPNGTPSTPPISLFKKAQQ